MERQHVNSNLGTVGAIKFNTQQLSQHNTITIFTKTPVDGTIVVHNQLTPSLPLGPQW